jgi:hypothetical protein
MNQGALVVPFAILLVMVALFDARMLLAVWTFTWVGMPTLRSRFGPVSVYWCDVAAIAATVACFRWPPNDVSRQMSKWYLALALVHGVGVVTSLVRYNAILEPGYDALRYGFAFLPLLILPRVAPDPEAMDWFWRGILVAALWMIAVALIQSLWRDTALQLETLLYGSRSEGSASFAYRERALMFNTRLRVHGMYGASTCFAGAATMVGVLLTFRMSRERASPVTQLGFLGSAAAMLLTFSRHGLLAWAALLLPSFVRRPGRGSLVPLLMVAIVSVLGAGEFWAERIGRGGIQDDQNLSSRLVERPLELLDRISEEPSILLGGVGLGTSHILRTGEDGPSQEGFVSNGFALYLFYLGILGLGMVLVLLAFTLRTAWGLEGRSRAAALGGLGATVVIIASDNYGFLHTSFPFMWSALVALIYDRAAAPDSIADDQIEHALPAN